MNKRQKKKLIPKNTPYCYTIAGFREGGGIICKTCPHLKRNVEEREDVIYDANGEPHSCMVSVDYCSLMKVSTWDDPLLNDRVKICGFSYGD